MKKLYIIRHAKSSWKDMTLDDFDRPLNKRGQRDAPIMGELLKKKNVQADIIVSSPALRTKITAEIMAQKVSYSKGILYLKDIYEASCEKLHEILKELDNRNNIVFIFGHNTGFIDLAHKYIGLEENIPTCGVVEIDFDCKSWSEISSDNAKLISFEYPKKHL